MTRVPQHLKDRVEAEIRRCMAIAEETYGNRFTLPTIKYTVTGHSTAGWAKDSTYTVNFNAAMLIKYADDDFIEGRESTVTHEFAHLVDGIVNPQTRESKGYIRTRRGLRRAPRSVHGPTWKRIMMVLGANPSSRCHNYELDTPRGRKAGTIIVRCTCGCGKQGPMGAKRAAQWRIKPSRYSFHRGYALEEVREELPVAAKNAKPKAPKNGSKKEQAIGVYKMYKAMGKPRQYIISRIANMTGASEAYASTLYNIARKEVA